VPSLCSCRLRSPVTRASGFIQELEDMEVTAGCCCLTGTAIPWASVRASPLKKFKMPSSCRSDCCLFAPLTVERIAEPFQYLKMPTSSCCSSSVLVTGESFCCQPLEYSQMPTSSCALTSRGCTVTPRTAMLAKPFQSLKLAFPCRSNGSVRSPGTTILIRPR